MRSINSAFRILVCSSAGPAACQKPPTKWSQSALKCSCNMTANIHCCTEPMGTQSFSHCQSAGHFALLHFKWCDYVWRGSWWETALLYGHMRAINPHSKRIKAQLMRGALIFTSLLVQITEPDRTGHFSSLKLVSAFVFTLLDTFLNTHTPHVIPSWRTRNTVSGKNKERL